MAATTTEYPKRFVEGLGEIDYVGYEYGPDDKWRCKRCHGNSSRTLNYSMMWHEADIVCNGCDGYLRQFDAG